MRRTERGKLKIESFYFRASVQSRIASFNPARSVFVSANVNTIAVLEKIAIV